MSVKDLSPPRERRRRSSLRHSTVIPCRLIDWPLWLLFCAMVWVLVGAPLTQAEWQALPEAFIMRLHQLPWRMQQILLRWYHG